MAKLLLVVIFCTASFLLAAQSFEVVGLQEVYKGTAGEIIHAPIRIKNNSDKVVTLIVKKAETQLGSSQKNYFCHAGNCLELASDTYILKLAAGETSADFSIGMEAGLTEGFSVARYTITNKANPGEIDHIELNFSVVAKPEKSTLYTSPFITLHDVYPNPVVSSAQVDYQLVKDQVKAKIVIHNLLGTPLSVHELLAGSKTLKIDVSPLNSGIYFYTLYVNNESVLTRKLLVKK